MKFTTPPARIQDVPFVVMLWDLWKARFFLLFGGMTGLLCAVLFVAMVVPFRQAHMTVMPADFSGFFHKTAFESGTGRGESRDGAREGGFPAGQAFSEFQAKMHGPAVASLLLRSPDIVRGLQADSVFYFSKPETEWTPEKLAEYIEKRVVVSPVGETLMRNITYWHADPRFSVFFLQRLQAVTDNLIRYGIRKSVDERISYLRDALVHIVNPEHRRAVTDLLMEQERLRMLVSMEQPFSATVVEQAFVSPRAVWPDFSLVVVVCSVTGVFLGFFCFHAWRASCLIGAQKKVSAEKIVQDTSDFKARLEGMRKGWHKGRGDNNNQRPLTGKHTGKKTDVSSDAAE